MFVRDVYHITATGDRHNEEQSLMEESLILRKNIGQCDRSLGMAMKGVKQQEEDCLRGSVRRMFWVSLKGDTN